LIARFALLLTVVALPFAIVPARFEPYDPSRVGALALLLLVGLPALRLPRPAADNRALYFACAAWIGALMIATLFALSPARALAGDLIRRMGLLTHLLLVAGVLVGATLDARQIARGFWLAGVIVGALVVLQTLDVLPNPFQDAVSDRPSGLIGTPPAVGGWLALALLWAMAGWFTPAAGRQDTPPPAPPRKRGGGLIYALGIGVIALGLLLTEARGGLLAAAGGAYVLALGWALWRRWRVAVLALALLAMSGAAGAFILARVDWGDSILTRLPLIARLNPALPDSPRIAREIIWGSALALIADPSALAAVDVTPDHYAGLRRWIGHGPESFETAFRPWVTPELRRHEGGRPIDRAHNDWLDTGVIAGWLGMAARLALWLALAYTAWRRARAGQLVALVLLAIIAAHFVDLTFSFTGVLSGWAFWLAVGALLRGPDRVEAMIQLGERFRGRAGRAAQVVALMACAALVVADAGADLLLARGVGAGSFLTPTAAERDPLFGAAALRPWDDRLWAIAANSALRQLSDDPSAADAAESALARSIALNPYDGWAALWGALLATWRAEAATTVTAYEAAIAQAGAYHAAAARLMPGEPVVWREWGRFALTFGDLAEARAWLTRALALDPGDAEALALRDSLPPGD
jgi:O-antigen ligase